MSDLDSIDGIAMEANWIALGARLSQAMRRFHEYGYHSPEDLLRAVAFAQGSHPMSLKKPIAAADWLAKEHPHVHAARLDTVPMSNVLQLKTIDAISPDHARAIADDVFKGRLSRRQLKDILEDVRRNNSNTASTRRGPAAIAKDFEDLVFKYVSENLAVIAPQSSATVCYGDVVRPAADFVIFVDGVPMIAIEAKASRTNTHERHLLETLGIVSLRQNQIRKNLIIGTQAWLPSLQTLDRLSDEFGLYDLSIAALVENRADRKEKHELLFVRKRL